MGEAGGQPLPTGRRHVPVLLERCLELLAPALTADPPGPAEPAGPADRDGARVLVDATLGLGGHAEAALRRFPAARLVGVDRDPEALRLAAERLAPYAGRTTLVHAVYDELPDVLAAAGTPRVQAVLFDLGVSSLQLDETARGFAYAQDAPLDMRMDQGRGRSAADVVNTYAVEDLTRVLREYGEERFARRIAEAVVRARRQEPFTGTARLAELVRAAVPAATRRVGGHPAKRTFQALRIEVNAELDALARALPSAVAALAVGGRIVVLSYHSLEDRMVKRVLTAGAADTSPPGLPVPLEEAAPRLRLLTRGAEAPSAEEVARNPRAASARLRAAERIREAA